jgi:Tfp pilus assembly protein PilX
MLPSRARGFAMMTVVFVLVIMATVIAALSQWVVRSDHLLGLSVREARATAAARAALQWGAWQVRDPRGTLFPGAAALPDCFASPKTLSLSAPLDEFTVQVSCSRTPASPGAYAEDQRQLAIFVLSATAVSGTASTPERVERRLEMRIEACKDAAGAAPTWSC